MAKRTRKIADWKRRARLAFDERERHRQYQRQVDKKTADSRQKWDIDELTKKRDQAAQDLQQNSGFLAGLTGKKARAEDMLDAQEKTLQERLGRFEADINAFNEDRSQEIQTRELKKHGFNADQPSVEIEPKETLEQAQKLKPSNDNMNKKSNEPETPPASFLNAKKKKIFDSRREWELVAFEKSVEEQAIKMYQASARPIEQKFNDIGERRSPEELKKTIETMKEDNENDLRESFEDGLSSAHKEALSRFRSENPQAAEQKQETKSQAQDQSQSQSIDHD